jgi:hypothetical protein
VEVTTMKPHRALGLFAAAALVACGGQAATLVATTSSPAPGTGPAAPGSAATAAGAYRLAVRENGPGTPHVGIVDANRDALVAHLPDGVPSPDWSRLYTLDTPTAVTSVLRIFDLVSGALVREVALGGRYALPTLGAAEIPTGLSPNGEWLALVDPAGPNSEARTKSAFLILDTSGASPPRRVDIPGRFAFDGIANDGDNLYLLESLGRAGAAATGEYHVRHYVLSQSQLDPRVIVDKNEPDGPMTGLGLTRVASRDGAWQFTLYVFGSRGPFVHALELATSVAVCIDLPRPTGHDQSGELAWSLALSRDGSRLFAVNGASGAIAEISAQSPRLQRTAQVSPSVRAAAAAPLGGVVAEAKRIVEAGAALSPDGKTLYAVGEQSLLAIDTPSLGMRAELLRGEALSGVAISPDGRWLFAAVEGGGIVPVDVSSGAAVGTLHAAVSPRAVLRVDPV